MRSHRKVNIFQFLMPYFCRFTADSTLVLHRDVNTAVGVLLARPLHTNEPEVPKTVNVSPGWCCAALHILLGLQAWDVHIAWLQDKLHN